MNANLEARVDYLRSPSVVKQMRDAGTLDSVVTKLITTLQRAGEDVPHHIMGLRSPSVIKALAAVDLLKSGGARREEDQNEDAEAADAETSADASGGADPRQRPDAQRGNGMAGKPESGGGKPGAGADGGGPATGSTVDGEGWEEFFKDPSEVVRAKKMTEPFTVKTLENRGGEVMHGKAGDYLVEGLRGDQWVVDGKIFDETYRNVGEWKQVKKTANPEKEVAKFDGKPPAQDQVGPAQSKSDADQPGDKAGAGPTQPDQSTKGAAGSIPKQDAPGRAPVNGGKGGIDPKDLDTKPKPGAQKGTNRHPSAQQADQGRPGALAPHDRLHGFKMEEVTADDIFAAYEDWEQGGGAAHFAEGLTNLADEGGAKVYGLKVNGDWGGFVAYNQTKGALEVAYLETSPILREQDVEGMGTRLLAQVLEDALTEGAKVVVNAMTESASYFKLVGAKHIGGTRFEFDTDLQQKFIKTLLADVGKEHAKPGMHKSLSGYERRKQEKSGKGQNSMPEEDAIHAAEAKLPHGLLVGPVSEAAGARVRRYYNPGESGRPQTAQPGGKGAPQGQKPMQKSLLILTPSELRKRLQ